MDLTNSGHLSAASAMAAAAAAQMPLVCSPPSSSGSDASGSAVAAAAAAVLASGGSFDEQPRKLAVLGLPWETTEDTLRLHFGQYGVVEAAEVMKDRFSGKSRGFGFVTYVDPAAAQRALSADHVIDGRRCEAKVALPKTLLQGDPLPARTTRIFVARIPAAVSEGQFRSYFERFGKLQDAYMPRDHSKQAYRGIGFVTFASPDSVEKVMACKHWMNGHEIAIDRATPKDDTSAPSGRSSGQFSHAGGNGGAQRRSFDNGAGIVGPGLTPVMAYAGAGGAAPPPPALASLDAASAAALNSLRSLAEDAELAEVTRSLDAAAAAAAASLSNALGLPSAMDAAAKAGSAGAAFGMPQGFNQATLQNLAKAHAALGGLSLGGLGHLAGLPSFGLPPLGGFGAHDMSALNNALGNALAAAAAVKPMSPPSGGGARKSLDSAMHSLAAVGAAVHGQQQQHNSNNNNNKRSENPVIASARAGPRIFIGKLTKDTTESDVKEYFSRFGYVMDVYMPKAKDNRAEHRGFGFVTFETDAAIKRVVGAGSHRLKGSTIAIDIAMPKVDDDSGDAGAAAMAAAASGLDAAAAAAAAASMGAAFGSMGLGGLPPTSFDAAAAAVAAAAAARQFQSALPLVMQ